MGVYVCGIERGVEGAWEAEAASEASGLGDWGDSETSHLLKGFRKKSVFRREESKFDLRCI